MKRNMMSASFRRDYVAYSAILIFILIVIGEIVLAFWIPSYVKNGRALALQESRQMMIDSFDDLRTLINNEKISKDNVRSEVNLIAWNLNIFATYLRANSSSMKKREIAEITKDLNEFHKIYDHLKQTGAYAADREIDLAPRMKHVADSIKPVKP